MFHWLFGNGWSQSARDKARRRLTESEVVFVYGDGGFERDIVRGSRYVVFEGVELDVGVRRAVMPAQVSTLSSKVGLTRRRGVRASRSCAYPYWSHTLSVPTTGSTASAALTAKQAARATTRATAARATRAKERATRSAAERGSGRPAAALVVRSLEADMTLAGVSERARAVASPMTASGQVAEVEILSLVWVGVELTR